jgi:regulator of protease activity HflC (stomatin/prohibitin superfamily)
MSNTSTTGQKTYQHEEYPAPHSSGMFMMLLNIGLMLASIAGIILGAVGAGSVKENALYVLLIIVSIVYSCIVGPILFGGLKILKPNEALVLTLFGKYVGTLKGAGFFFVNPFVSAVNPAAEAMRAAVAAEAAKAAAKAAESGTYTATPLPGRKISLKAMTLSNDKQKINDRMGNPIIIGIVVIWRVVNTAKAVFNVDNYQQFLSIQCDSALRNIVRLYPYDNPNDENESSLRGSSQEVAERLKEEIQAKVDIAGLEVLEARITHLSYATEIAAAMLQRQQASAIVDARQLIVEGAVGMVEMALHKLNENQVVVLDEERKAAMVSNLLVVLCGNRDAQPVVNSGSLY